MKEPTDEQKKVFWEGYGFENVHLNLGSPYALLEPEELLGSLNGGEIHIPNVDDLEFLGFLFKHAVPKVDIDKIVFDGYDEWFCHIYIPEKPRRFIDFIGKPPKTKCVTQSGGVDPALALFWVLDKVRANE